MSDLVVVSLERWDDVWRRNQYLVDGLLREDAALRVLFVEPAADPLHDVVSRRAPSWGRRPSALGDSGRLWTFRPVKPLPRRLDPRADERLAGAIERAAIEVGFRSPLLWINDPGMAPVMRSTGWTTLYDITDDWLAADRPVAELERLTRGETSLLEDAAEVVACSPELVRRKSAARPEGRHPIVLIQNAVDVAAYRRPRPRPDDLPAGRTAVYVGTIHADRFDVDLAVATARELGTDATLVLVGPPLLSPEQTSALADAGAVILGARPRDAVIGYLQHADVLLVPHLVTPFTDSLDPIKLYEYQAVGRPVVATAVAGFRDADDPSIAVVAASRFPAAVRLALETGPSESIDPRHPVADWSDRTRAMKAVVDRMRPQPG